MPYPREVLALFPNGARLSSSQLAAFVDLESAEIRLLIEFGAFPAARCGRNGVYWNAKKVAAWGWGLKNSAKLANTVSLILGYRGDDWAR